MIRRLTHAIALVLGWTLAGSEALAQDDERARINIQVHQADLSFEELQRLVPALPAMRLPDDFHIQRLRASGPLTSLSVEFAIRSDESEMSGTVTGNFTGPRRTAKGTVTFDDMNLARLLGRSALPTQLRASSTFDLTFETAGDTTSIIGDYSVEAQRIIVSGYTAADVAASGRFDGQRVLVDRASARAYGGSFTVEGAVSLPLGPREVTYDLSGRAANVDLTRLPASLPAPPLDSNLAFTYQLTDRGQGLTGRAQLARSQIAGGVIADGTVVTFDMSGERIRYSVTGRMLDIDPAAIGRALDIEAMTQERFAGVINAAFKAEGIGTSLQPVSLTLTDSRLFGGTIPNMQAEVTLLENEVRFAAKGDFADLDAGTLADDMSLEGSFTGSLDVSGALARSPEAFDWHDLTLAGEVRLTDGRFEQIPIDHLDVSGRVAGMVIELERLDVEGPDLTANAEGTLSLDGTSPSMLSYHIDTPRLGAFSDLIGDVGGDLTFDGQISGVGTLRIDGALEGSDVSYGGVAASTVDAKYEVALPPGQPASASAAVHGEATFVRVAGRTLTEAIVDAQYSDRRVSFDARVHENERTITSTGDLLLLPERQQITLTAFRFEAPAVLWEMPSARVARIDYGDTRIVVDGFHLEAPGGQTISVDGVIGRTTDDGPLEVRIEDLALSDLDRLVFGEQGIAGRADVLASLHGPLNLPRVDARFAILDGAVRGFKYQSLTGTIESSGSAYQFSARVQQDPAAWLTAEGQVPRTLLGGAPGDGMIDVVVRSSPFGLGFVTGFTDAVSEVQGTIQADVRVTGTLEQPFFDGQLAIRQGAFRASALGTRFTGLDTEILFEPEGMLVREFHLLDENGERLRFAGRLPYDTGRTGEVAIAVSSENFEIIDNDAADIQVSADLAITGALTAPRLEGSVRITDGEIRVDRILDLRRGSYYRAAPVESTEEAAAAVEQQQEQENQDQAGLLRDSPLALDVKVALPALLITGRDLRGPSSLPIGLGDINLTVEGEVQLDKSVNEALVITGNIATVRGTYEFQGRRFEILREGEIQFPGQVEINPLLDVTAQRTISGVEAQVHVGGTLRQPELTLSSQPPLDQADILSLIVFNQPASQLGASDQVSLGRRAAALATGFVASQLAESIGNVLDLDQVQIEAGGPQVEGLAPSITVGEQVGENLFLRLQQQFGPASSSQFLLEYEFAEWLRLQTTVSDRTEQSQSPFRRGERSGVNWIFSFTY